jgi:hypothetical protein
MKTQTIKLSAVILDFNLYPRVDVDSQHVSYLKQAFEAGTSLPPLLIDAKSKRVIDGFHRVKMYRSIDEDMSVEVVLKSYSNESDMLLDSMRHNAGHGRMLTRYDRTHCILLAEKLKVPDDELASALNMTVARLGELRVDRIGTLKVGQSTSTIPLKRTIRHMRGKRLNQRQEEAQHKLSGMNQAFYVNQVILLIESHLLDYTDENLIERLKHLAKLLSKIKTRKLSQTGS